MTPELRIRAALALIDGKLRDELSADAFVAWERRWRRVPVGFGRRLEHLLRSALAMDPTVLRARDVDIDKTDEPGIPPERWPSGPAPMPLGAVRAEVAERGRYWEPSLGRSGRWLATLPVYESREPPVVTFDRYIRWQFGHGYRAKDGRVFETPTSLVGDVLHGAIVEAEDCADAPESVVIEAVNAALADAAETTVATTPRYLAAHEIIAFDPREPSRWWTRTGSSDALGRDQAELDLAADKPVRVYATPATWNRAGAGGAPGCCVLDWKSGWARQLLLHTRGLIGDSIEHGEELKKRLLRTLPTVGVATRRKAA